MRVILKKVGTVTTLRSARSGVRIPVGARDFSIHRKVQTGSKAHPASYSRPDMMMMMMTVNFPSIKNVPVFPFPPHTLMASTWISLFEFFIPSFYI